MDSAFWASHWWLIVILAALAIPVCGMVLGAITTLFLFLHKKHQLDVIKAYAAQGKDPPLELVAALNSKGWGRKGYYDAPPWVQGMGAAAADPATRAEVREEWRETWRSLRRREPMRSWRGAITLCALAGGFYVASLYAGEPNTSHSFLLTAIIIGAVGAGRLISAILLTVYREK